MRQLDWAAWRLLAYNWIPICVMAAALVVALELSTFSIQFESVAMGVLAAGIFTVAAYRKVRTPLQQDPLVVFVLGSTAQLVLITLLMTPMTYIAASANLPMVGTSLASLDRALGLDWYAYFAFIYERPKLIAAVVVSYAMIGVELFAIPVVLAAAREYRRLQVFTFAFGLALVLTTVLSALLPAIGTYDELGIRPNPSIFTPGSYLDQLHDLPLVRAGALRAMDMRALAGIITFPSFHAACAVLYLWAFWGLRWVRPIAVVVNGAMLLATPMAGGHYFVDVIAGAGVALLTIKVALWVAERLTASAVQAAPSLSLPRPLADPARI